jgi:glycosyltransferase involved in cell wall biosynthesis
MSQQLGMNSIVRPPSTSSDRLSNGLRLLICTQAVDRDDANLGFFVRWIEEFAKHCEYITVICLRKGAHSLPKSVEVISLGERNKVLRALEVCTIAFGRRYEYNAVFVHMNPEYIIAAGWLWKLLRKKIGLWYVHKSVNLRLRIATFFASVIFTASKESFRLASSKVKIVGNGIDWQSFQKKRTVGEKMRITTIGRISRSKRVIEMLTACDSLHERGVEFELGIYGAPITKDDWEYDHKLRNEIQVRDYVGNVRLGALTHDQIPDLLAKTSVFINLSATGSIDKAVLEAIAAHVPVVTSNEAFKDMLPKGLYVSSNEPNLVADAIEKAVDYDMQALSDDVRTKHSLTNVIEMIVRSL